MGRGDNGERGGTRLLTRCLRDTSAHLANRSQAKLFASAVSATAAKPQALEELLYSLTDENQSGHVRLREAVTMCDSTADLEEIVVPLLTPIVDEKLSVRMYKARRERLLRFLFDIRGLMELASAEAASLSDEARDNSYSR